jgi:hypothetical protein
MSGRVALLAVLRRQLGEHGLDLVDARLPRRRLFDDLRRGSPRR